MKKNIFRFTVLFFALVTIGSNMFAGASVTISESNDPIPTPIDGSDYEAIQQFNEQNPVLRQGFSGGKKSSEARQTINPQVKTLTPQQIAKKISGENRVTAGFSFYENYKINSTRAVTWIQLSPFTYYAQQTDYSCGPACIRMALKYINGSTPSEASVRAGCNTTTYGTELYDMVEYINDQQNYNDYVRVTGDKNQTKLKNDLYGGIVDYDSPPIVGVWEDPDEGWPYWLQSHMVTIYGSYTDKSVFRICDPWAGYMVDDDNRWYAESISDLYIAYHNADLGYMW
jgi:predicted double-glycine peptidase